MRSSPGSVANSRACAVAVLAAGMLLLALGCARKPDAGNRGNAPPPARHAAGRTPPGGPGGAAEKRSVSNVEISLTMTLGDREVGFGEETEVPLGSEVAVREDVAWNHAESVNWYWRYWRASPAFRAGDKNRDQRPKNVRTDAGPVLIGGDTTVLEDTEDSRDLGIQPKSHGGAEVQKLRDYRLRFMKVGLFRFEVCWVAGFAEPGFGATEGPFAMRDFIVRVVDAPHKAAKPLH